jgi:hypothetical protein
MPNNMFRHKKGYQPVSGALRKVTRKEIAGNERATSSALSNSELGGGNGTPSPVSVKFISLPDSYSPVVRPDYEP